MPIHGPAWNPHNLPRGYEKAERGERTQETPEGEYTGGYTSLSHWLNDLSNPERDWSAIRPTSTPLPGNLSPDVGSEFLKAYPTMGRPPSANGIRNDLTSDSAYENQQVSTPPLYRHDLAGAARPSTKSNVAAAAGGPDYMEDIDKDREMESINDEINQMLGTDEPAQVQKAPKKARSVTTDAAKPTKDSFWRGDSPEGAAPFEMAVNWIARGLGGYAKLGAATTATITSLLNDFFVRGGAGKDATQDDILRAKKEAYKLIDSFRPGTSMYDEITDYPWEATLEPNNLLDASDETLSVDPSARPGNLSDLAGRRAYEDYRGSPLDPNTGERWVTEPVELDKLQANRQERQTRGQLPENMPIGQEEIFPLEEGLPTEIDDPNEATNQVNRQLDEIIENMGLMKLSQAQVAGAIGDYPPDLKSKIVRRIEDINQQDVGL
jgi:hypothetical protein